MAEPRGSKGPDNVDLDEANRKFQEAAVEQQEDSDRKKIDEVEKVVSEEEKKEGKDSKWLRGAKGFVKGGAKTLGLFLGLAGTIVAKLFEASFGAMKNMLEKPRNPEEWFKPFVDVWKTDKKKEKK